MIVQNEHWNGQPRPASKLVTSPGSARRANRGNERQRFALDVRQVRHEIVERLELVLESVLEHHFHAPFRFSGKDHDPHRLRLMQIGVVTAHHAQDPRGMESADADLNPAFA